jgi:hypothetical protein
MRPDTARRHADRIYRVLLKCGPGLTRSEIDKLLGHHPEEPQATIDYLTDRGLICSTMLYSPGRVEPFAVYWALAANPPPDESNGARRLPNVTTRRQRHWEESYGDSSK